MTFIARFLYPAVFLGLVSSVALASEALFDKHWKMTASVNASDFQSTIEKLRGMELDIAGVDLKAGKVDVLINDAEYEVLKREGFSLEITNVKGVARRPDQEYKKPDEIAQILRDYHERFPELTRLVSVGKSREGRDIWAIKISSNASRRDVMKPSVFFNSMHHAREVMTPEVALDIIEQLLENYQRDPQITAWVNELEIWVMPMFNVDGNVKMWEDDIWWRKNTRGGYGVDLNRNYPAFWKSCNGSSGWLWSQTYRGPSAGSEPETKVMMNFIADIRPVFSISYHSYSELVIYPFGCKGKKTPTADVVESLGQEMAQLLGYTAGTSWETLYNTDGGDIDWMYDAYQVIPYVIEVNSSREGFHPSYHQWRDVTVELNRAGWMKLLERAGQSGVRGVVSVNGNAASEFVVEVYKVAGQEKTHYQTYQGHHTGAFHLVLNPGEYELQFKGENLKGARSVKIGDQLLKISVEL